MSEIIQYISILLNSSYFYDRDMREGTTLLSELERVFEGSWLSIIILTPEFIECCLPRYLNLAIFRDCLTTLHPRKFNSTNQLSGRVMAIAVGVSEDMAKRCLPSCQCVSLKTEWRTDFQSWAEIESMVGKFGMINISS